MQATAEKLFDVQRRQGITRLRLADPARLDSLIISEFRDQLLDYIEREQPQLMIVDFDRVSHVSTEMIKPLLTARRWLAANGGTLILSGMKNQIRRVFRILRLDQRVFRINDTASDAEAAIARR